MRCCLRRNVRAIVSYDPLNDLCYRSAVFASVVCVFQPNDSRHKELFQPLSLDVFDLEL